MSAPLGYELRFWPEFARLLTEPRFWNPARPPERGEHRPPALLIPGFMAGDASLTVLAGWLRRRGHAVRTSGIRLNVGCAWAYSVVLLYAPGPVCPGTVLGGGGSFADECGPVKAVPTNGSLGWGKSPQ
jgi:hypothetical protein